MKSARRQQFARVVLKRLLVGAAGLCASLVMTSAYQITLTVNGPAWPPSPIDVTYLSSGAGSDFAALPQSAANYASINITGGGGNPWRVDVARVDSTWDTNLELSVRRTSNGTGTGSITSGQGLNNYLRITTSNQELFGGTDKLNAINLQYKLEKLSATMGVHAFSTTVRYTIVNL